MSAARHLQGKPRSGTRRCGRRWPSTRTPERHLMSNLTRTPARTTLDTSPMERVLDASLLLAPLAYLAVDSSYAVRGWDDGPTAAMHILAAAVYGIAAVKLVSMTAGRTEAVLL